MSGYPANFMVKCSNCNGVSHLPGAVRDESLPLLLRCQFCNHEQIWKTMPVLPKESGLTVSPVGVWICPSLSDERFAAKPAEQAIDLPPDYMTGIKEFAKTNPEEQPIPFFDTASQVGIYTRRVFGLVGLLHKQIDTFTETVARFFETKWKWAERFKRCYKRAYMQEFLDMPFYAMECPAEDELSAQYSRWIISPKFFDPAVGFHVDHSAGCRLELVNQYTRIYFPLETDIAQGIGVPEQLDLKVVSNKVIGASLPSCWDKIPGVVKDQDFTDEWPSVYIREPELARLWLARHGVRPWEPRAITPKELHLKEAYDAMYDDDLMAKAWERFTRYGRLGIFWSDVMHARRFAMLAGLMMQGITSIFVANHEDRMAWDSLYVGMGTGHHRAANELIFFRNGDPIQWKAIMKTKMTIVDMTGGIDISVLERLLAYEGRLLILCSDPIMDFDTENLLAPYVHTLAGFGIFDKSSNERWSGRRMQDSQIREALRSMTVKHYQPKPEPEDA